MEEGNQPSLLDTHTPAAIVDMLGAMPDATAGLTELIKKTPHQSIKKLKHIFLGINNYDMDALVELSQSPNRSHRYTVTFLVLSKIKMLCRRRADFGQIEGLYDSVFSIRFRDVDPLIRGMAVQFVAEWIIENAALRKMDYLKYIGWALNDRSDSVRRRAIRGLFKITTVLKRRAQLRPGKENAKNQRPGGAKEVMNEFYSKHRERFIEMACYDVNMHLKTDCTDLIILVFVSHGIFSEDDVLDIMKREPSVTPRKQEAMAVLCSDGIWNLQRIHEIYKKAGACVFKSLRLAETEPEALVSNIAEFTKANSACCESDTLCFLDILEELELSLDPAYFISLLEIVKDSRKNTLKAIEAITSIKTFREFGESTTQILGILKSACMEEPVLLEPFAVLLKKLEDDFGALVGEVVGEFKGHASALAAAENGFDFAQSSILSKGSVVGTADSNDGTTGAKNASAFILPLIKNFDVSDILRDDSTSLEKCYGALWMIIRGDFQKVQELKFADAGFFRELVDFLVFFFQQGRLSVEDKDAPDAAFVVCDSRSAFRSLFSKLYHLISSNFRFEDEQACMHLFKMVNLGIFADSASLLFEKCGVETLARFIENAKHVKALVCGFFAVLKGNGRVHGLAKALAAKMSKNDVDRYLFGLVKEHVEDKALLDSVLLHFVPLMNVNECIVLESMAAKSKFKTACMRKCKTRPENKSVENVTFI